MAADLILNAVAPFPGAEQVIPVLSGAFLEEVEARHALTDEQAEEVAEKWEPDWPFYVERVDDGSFEMVEGVEGNDDGIADLHEFFYDRDDYARIDIGPFSTIKAGLDNDRRWLPGPVVSLSRCLGIGQPVVMTPAKAAEIMVALNVADRSHYKDIAKEPRGYKAGRHSTWPGYYTLFSRRRTHRRRDVKKFLARHQGDLVWLSME